MLEVSNWSVQRKKRRSVFLFYFTEVHAKNSSYPGVHFKSNNWLPTADMFFHDFPTPKCKILYRAPDYTGEVLRYLHQLFSRERSIRPNTHILV